MLDLPIILASGSPRRRELLTHLVEKFTVLSVDVDESKHTDETPTQYIQRMVVDKAVASIAYLNQTKNQIEREADADIVNQSWLDGVNHTHALLILTADTIGVLSDDTVLLKPTDYDDAKAMWQSMSDDVHEVWTAVQATLVTKSANGCCPPSWQQSWQQSLLERTTVSFIKLSDDDMQAYWQTGEPADKAGGYAIQGRGAVWVRRIEGSHTNVVGLPLAQTKALIEAGQKACQRMG